MKSNVNIKSRLKAKDYEILLFVRHVDSQYMEQLLKIRNSINTICDREVYCTKV